MCPAVVLEPRPSSETPCSPWQATQPRLWNSVGAGLAVGLADAGLGWVFRREAHEVFGDVVGFIAMRGARHDGGGAEGLGVVEPALEEGAGGARADAVERRAGALGEGVGGEVAVGAAEIGGEAAAGLGEGLDGAGSFGVGVAEQARGDGLAGEAGAFPLEMQSVAAASAGVAQQQLVVAGGQGEGAVDGAPVDLELDDAGEEPVIAVLRDGDAAAEHGAEIRVQGRVERLAGVEIKVGRGDDLANGDGAIGVRGDEAWGGEGGDGGRESEQEDDKRLSHPGFLSVTRRKQAAWRLYVTIRPWES